MAMKAKKKIRADFKTAVFARDNNKCIICHEPAVDAHHIIDRSLWEDGGYHLDNGASLCEKDHLKAESGNITPVELRKAAGIKRILLPDALDPEFSYNKWGEKSYI